MHDYLPKQESELIFAVQYALYISVSDFMDSTGQTQTIPHALIDYRRT